MSKKEQFKNFAAGATRAVAETGLAAVKGYGKLSVAIGKRTTGNTIGGEYVQKMANRANVKLNDKIGKRADTKMGKTGGFVALTALPVGRAIKGYSAGVKAAKAAVIQHQKRSLASKKGAETYRNSLPHTAESVESPRKPIYPLRNKKK